MRFAIHTLQSLLYDLSDLSKLRHVFIEHLYVLVRDGLEHLREASIFPEKITIQVLHVQAVRSFISSFGGEAREEEEKERWEMEEEIGSGGAL